ncbi:phage tail terminator family protein [Fusibacter ferrireducens]|uniref:Uncharacterized protein n=1 Tax=Fusibacter ferrireducens TaxID=2785058 RepID=A0ABR9ZU84_9FIRM|nr:hypothetical protein [Fusibacter ferrireducens]MBF4693906.1 hypothetical protein [Fusibacter ferrireducens]
MTEKAYELVKQKLQLNLPTIQWVDEVIWPADESRPCFQLKTLSSDQNMISRDLMAVKVAIQLVYYGPNSTASHDELVAVSNQVLNLFQNAFETLEDQTRFETSQIGCEIKEGLLHFKITLETQLSKVLEVYPVMENLNFREV